VYVYARVCVWLINCARDFNARVGTDISESVEWSKSTYFMELVKLMRDVHLC